MLRLLFFNMVFLSGTFLIGSNPGNVSVEKARYVFETVVYSEKAGLEFLALTEQGEILSPLMKGYRGAVMMMMAHYGFNPVTKWNNFSDGRKLLELAIASDSNNPELIYLRFCIQTNAPSFLGYHDQIKKDHSFLKKSLAGIDDKVLYQRINSYLNRTAIKKL